ncbi:hypothetical protein X975_15929, partial [Stegodyphus mimosarum]
MSGKDSSRDNASLSESKLEKILPGQSPEALNLALRYSTQAYQENSGLYSPSSQTSSVTSSVPDTTFSRPKSRRDLQPSASDVSDADSGLQSMISPNIATLEAEKNALTTDTDHTLLNGYGNDANSYSCFKGDSGECASFKIVNKYANLQSERDSHFDDTVALHAKLNVHQTKNIASVRHYAPMAAIFNSSEDNCCLLPNHHQNIGHVHVGKSAMHPYKTNYFEYPNSSVENSPCSAFAPLPSDDSVSPLLRTNSEPYVYSRQHIQSNVMTSQHSKLEDKKRKNIDASNASSTDSLLEKDHLCAEPIQDCCSRACISHQIRDKTHMHQARCSKSCCPNFCRHFGKDQSSEINESNCCFKNCSVIPKGLNQITQSKVTSPLDENDSPQSPCTVEMSGRISHSCSFQSDGFTAAEELSATATVKLFSTRAVSMTCTNGAISPQTSSQRPLSLNDASPQTNLRSPLVLAASVWEKKVQDIESTFHQLQTQIRDLEGAFGQIGQFGQFFYPGILQEDPKEPRPALHCAEPPSGALVLDMPKINFKRTDSSNNDLLFQTRFSGSVPFLSHSSLSHNQQLSGQHLNDCRVEELDQDIQPLTEEIKDAPKASMNSNESSKMSS